MKKKMKKFFNISLLTIVALSTLSLSSCKNEIDDIFDEDAVTRLEKAKAEYTNILTDKGGKWQLEYYANDEEPGYIYLMTFAKDGSVTIAGHNKWINYIKTGSVTTASSYGSEVSMWEVIADNGPVLSFNTYNKYFHIFADPYDIPSVGGATSDDDVNEDGYGHEGDYEFDIMKYVESAEGDTLFLTGKKYNLNMIMTRVGVNQPVDDEVYMNEVVAMADSFFNAKVPQVYINLPNGVRWIVKNGATSILKMFREGADEISTAETHNVIITHDGLSFMDPLTIDGYTIQNFTRQADGSLLCRDDHETTMTADPLAVVFDNRNLIWRADFKDVGGRFAELVAQLTNELKAYNKSTLQYAQIEYDRATEVYKLSFNIKKSTVKYNPTYFFTMEQVNENQVKFNVAAEGDKMGETYATKCPAIRAIVDELGSTTINLTANSLLAPVNMKTSVNGNDYIVWNLQ